MKKRIFFGIWLLSFLISCLYGCSRLRQRRLLSRGGVYYKVKKGDTLSKLSKRYQVPVDDIFVANLLKSKDEIYAGQRLFIPLGRKRAKNGHVSGHGKKFARPRKTKKKKTWWSFSKKKERPLLKKSLKSISLRWPVKGKITSKFGVKRSKHRHKGIDIAAKMGTKVKAASAGKVIYSDNKLRHYGNVIILKNARNWFTVYAHNSRNLVSEGDWVERGKVIAAVGKTGRATGSHLHFEVWKGRVSVNPLSYLPKR